MVGIKALPIIVFVLFYRISTTQANPCNFKPAPTLMKSEEGIYEWLPIYGTDCLFDEATCTLGKILAGSTSDFCGRAPAGSFINQSTWKIEKCVGVLVTCSDNVLDVCDTMSLDCPINHKDNNIESEDKEESKSKLVSKETEDPSVKTEDDPESEKFDQVQDEAEQQITEKQTTMTPETKTIKETTASITLHKVENTSMTVEEPTTNITQVHAGQKIEEYDDFDAGFSMSQHPVLIFVAVVLALACVLLIAHLLLVKIAVSVAVVKYHQVQIWV